MSDQETPLTDNEILIWVTEADKLLPTLDEKAWRRHSRRYIADHAYLRGVADTEAKQGNLQEQIDQLANFIIAEIPGEPSQSQGAVDTAIRIMADERANGAGLVAVLRGVRQRLLDASHSEVVAIRAEGYIHTVNQIDVALANFNASQGPEESHEN